MSELFFVGFGLMEMIHFDINSKKARKRIHDISEVTGKKYAQFHYYVMKGAEFTYGYLAFTIMCLLSTVAANAALALLGIVLAILAVMYLEQNMENLLHRLRCGF